MVEVFEFDDNDELILSSEKIHLIPEFSFILKGDKTRGKAYSLKFFKYVFLRYSYRSPYFAYNEIDKEINAKESSGLTSTWAPSTGEENAIKKFIELEENASPSLPMLNTVRKKLHEIREFIDNLNVSATDDRGVPIYKLKDIMNDIKAFPELQKVYATFEESVRRETSGKSNIRGGAELGMDEDVE